MDLLSLTLSLLILGVGLYLINVYVPMQSSIKKIVNIVFIVFAILLALQAFGLLGPLRELRLR